MASRTQLRLGQLTGSFKDTDGGIIDSRSAGSATLASIELSSGSMVGIMSEVVSSIKRLHGAGSFAANAAGEFSQSITPASDDGAALGSASKNWSDLFIADEGVINLGDDQDVTLTHVPDAGVTLNSTSKLHFQDTGTFIQSPADGKLLINSDGALDDAIEIKTTNAAGEIVIESAHTAGRAVHIAANTAAGSILDIDAGILQIDATGVAGINSGGTLSLGTANSGVAVSIGHTTSEVTINDNLTVTGDLTVNGDTVSLDVTNKSIEDQLIILNSGSAADPANQDVGIIFAQPNLSRVLFIDNSNSDKFTFATTYTSGTAVGANAVTPVGNADVVMGNLTTDGITNDALTDNRVVIAGTSGVLEDDANFTFDGSDLQLANNIGLVFSTDDAEKIESDGTDLTVNSGADINLTATNDVNLPQDVGLTFGNDGEIIEGNGTRLSIKSGTGLILDCEGDITIDAGGGDILLHDDGTLYGGLVMAGTELTISSSRGDMEFNALGNNYTYKSDGTGFAQLGNSSGDFVIKPVGNNKDIIFKEDGGNEIVRLDSDVNTFAFPQQNAAGNAGNTGLLTFNGTDDVNEAIYGDGSYLYLRSNAVNFRLPNANAAADGYALVADGTSGNLTFAAVGSDAVTKGIKILTGSGVTAGTAVNFNAVDAGSTVSGLSTAEAQGKSLDVYVNGQLLLSGSSAERSAGSRDYEIASGTELKFAFDLEIDDVVQLIKR
jgi:hypothetical protein